MKYIRPALRVILTKEQWLQLNVAKHREFVRAAFYLGLPYEFIRLKANDPGYDEERCNTIETALEMGMSDDDEVYIVTGKRT